MAESSEAAAKRRGRGKPFQPGQSGNPGGRLKRTQEEMDLISACKDRTPAALSVIESIMMEGENERNRLTAAQMIIERAYGKPIQAVEATGKDGEPLIPKEVSNMEIARRIAYILATAANSEGK